MLQAAVRLISTQGSIGTGLREIVAASDARGRSSTPSPWAWITW
jgi:hypothetical protein